MVSLEELGDGRGVVRRVEQQRGFQQPQKYAEAVAGKEVKPLQVDKWGERGANPLWRRGK